MISFACILAMILSQAINSSQTEHEMTLLLLAQTSATRCIQSLLNHFLHWIQQYNVWLLS